MRSKLKALQQKQVEGDHGMSFDSSASGADSSTQSSLNGQRLYQESWVGLGLDTDEKLLPEKSTNKASTKPRRMVGNFGASKYPQFDPGGESMEISPLGFSFKPGDDTDILTQKMTRALGSKTVVGIKTYQPCNSNSKEEPEESCRSTQMVVRSRRSKSTRLVIKPKLQGKPRRNLQEPLALTRDISTSSITTAVLANPQHSSGDSSRHRNQSARQRLTRNSGSNEAVTAAIRALEFASAGSRGSPRKGSSSGTGEGSLNGEESYRIDEVDGDTHKDSEWTSSGPSNA
jgi:hypothetical protein